MVGAASSTRCPKPCPWTATRCGAGTVTEEQISDPLERTLFGLQRNRVSRSTDQMKPSETLRNWGSTQSSPAAVKILWAWRLDWLARVYRWSGYQRRLTKTWLEPTTHSASTPHCAMLRR